MNNEQLYKKTLQKLLESSVRELRPDVVLLSGGIDSSILAYLGKIVNPDICAITVATRGKESPDVFYAKKVVEALGIKNHIIAEIDPEEIEQIIHDVVVGLKNFNIFWVSAATVLYKGLSVARTHNFHTVLTGEGSDDLFGTFPVMQNWRYSSEELVKFISVRMQDIDVMTKRMAGIAGINIALPFHDENVVDFVLNLPLNIRTKIIDGEKITKYLLRETFREFLPSDIVKRPQTMAFSGASTLETFMEKYGKNEVATSGMIDKIDFENSFEQYLFSIYQNAGLYHPQNSGLICIHCKSAMRSKDSVHCVSCGTLQYHGEKLPF